MMMAAMHHAVPTGVVYLGTTGQTFGSIFNNYSRFGLANHLWFLSWLSRDMSHYSVRIRLATKAANILQLGSVEREFYLHYLIDRLLFVEKHLLIFM
jgi:hypothetical protein